jgi:signal transduction histidine kinase
MQIKTKLTYQFSALVAIILLISSTAVYLSFSKIRKEEFYDRLSSKSKLVAQMLFEIEEIDAELLKRIEENNPLSLPNEKIIIINYENQRIYDTDDEISLDISEEIINKTRLEGELRLIQKPYEIIAKYYTDKYDRIVVVAAATDIFGFGKLRNLRIILIIVFISSLLITYFAGRLFSIRALRPVSDIIDEVNHIEFPGLDARLKEGESKDELASLTRTFNKMLERMETAFNIQKSFINNASHELRNPLTVIRGQIEVVLMKERENEDYIKTLRSVLEDIQNLNQVSDRLLLLAQTRSEYSYSEFNVSRIDDALWSSRNEIIKLYPGCGIDIDFSNEIDDENKLMIYSNERLLKTAFINLLDNACKYSREKYVKVTLKVSFEGLIISFCDNGPGIPVREQEFIFQPFYRGESARMKKGHGIGLSLVESIIRLHNGNIKMESSPDNGSCFTIFLPYK